MPMVCYIVESIRELEALCELHTGHTFGCSRFTRAPWFSVLPIMSLQRRFDKEDFWASCQRSLVFWSWRPTGELASQVLGNFRALSRGGLPCRSIAITGGEDSDKGKTQIESLEIGADVIVATPGRLLQQLEAGNVHFHNLKSVDLDAVDILFDDEDFSKALETINKAASNKVQYIHVTATLPVDIYDDLLERYPDCLSLMGPSLHRPAIGLQKVLVDCSGGEEDDKTPESALANKRKTMLQL